MRFLEINFLKTSSSNIKNPQKWKKIINNNKNKNNKKAPQKKHVLSILKPTPNELNP